MPVPQMMQLLECTRLDEEQQDYCITALSSAESLLSIIDEILDFSKIEAGQLSIHPVPFTLHNLVHNTVGLFAKLAREKKLPLNIHFAPHMPDHFIGDPDRVRQILVNFLSNAIKFTDQGCVTVHLSYPAQENSEPALIIAVEDTGIGIASEKLNVIFDDFTQVDPTTTRTYGGTGLGLTICRQLAGLMNGEVGVSSTLGVGSTFFASLPFPIDLSGETNSPHSEAVKESKIPIVEPKLHIPVQTSARLLLVEDNVINQKVAESFLHRLGFTADIANNGLQALEKYNQNNYDMILMDLQMPELGGLETTKRIRQSEVGTGKHLPIVAMTARAMEGDRELCLSAGMDDYLSKPVKMKDLEKVLNKHLPKPLS